jgi:glycosyltransferase involved in cell wall biosynthesis
LVAKRLPEWAQHRAREAGQKVAQVYKACVRAILSRHVSPVRRIVKAVHEPPASAVSGADGDDSVRRADQRPPPGAASPVQRRGRVERARNHLRTLGFTGRAVEELQGLAMDATDLPRQRRAAWELALWYADQYNPAAASTALYWLVKAAEGETRAIRLRRIAVITAESQEMLGNRTDAVETIERALQHRQASSLLLARANLATTPTERLIWMNRALEVSGIPPVALRQHERFEGLNALTGGVPTAHRLPTEGGKQPCVSVLISAENSEDTIGTALRSLQAQTWRNLEIVVVVPRDSNDGTDRFVRRFGQHDPRIRVVNPTTDGGMYANRNTALRIATGSFVTCHEADAWSHPEMIARQVRHLLQQPTLVGNTSQQAFVSTDMRFHRRGNPGYFVTRNLTSFMFRREPVMKEIGYWDSVRFGADEELVRRVQLVFGTETVVDLKTGPLCIQQYGFRDLDLQGHFGHPGFFRGARQDYFESYEHHHRKANTLRYDFPQLRRPFPVAGPLLPRQPGGGRRRHFDVVIASDFRLRGGSTRSSIEEIKAQRQLGLRTGLMQMSRYHNDSRVSVLPEVRDTIDGDRVQMLVHGERISCNLLIVRYPPVLQHWQRYLPDVEPDRVHVIVNQPPMSHYGPGAALRYNISDAAENLQKYFGVAGTWYPIGPLIRRALHEHHDSELKLIDLSGQDWVNIIDVAAWRRESRPASRQRIRIGRHSRDHPLKWPVSVSEILSIYPDSSKYDVHILGGGDEPKRILGYWPENWRAWRFGELDPRDFLATLDAFVYYTHPEWVESFGRVILEAMAVGVPAILPNRYWELFQGAAIYAEPFEVLSKVERLMADDDYYEKRVRTAQQYVEDNFGYAMHAKRISEPGATEQVQP